MDSDEHGGDEGIRSFLRDWSDLADLGLDLDAISAIGNSQDDWGVLVKGLTIGESCLNSLLDVVVPEGPILELLRGLGLERKARLACDLKILRREERNALLAYASIRNFIVHDARFVRSFTWLGFFAEHPDYAQRASNAYDELIASNGPEAIPVKDVSGRLIHVVMALALAVVSLRQAAAAPGSDLTGA